MTEKLAPPTDRERLAMVTLLDDMWSCYPTSEGEEKYKAIRSLLLAPPPAPKKVTPEWIALLGFHLAAKDWGPATKMLREAGLDIEGEGGK